MIYFILWVLLIVAVIVSVPVASWLDNKKRRDLAGPAETPHAADDESPDEAFADEAAPAEFGDEFGEAEAEPIEVSGGEDFSAFDDEFK